MKRYRIVAFDFDSIPMTLNDPDDSWEENVKKLHLENKEKTIKHYRNVYGEYAFSEKIKNIKDLGNKPFSVLAYHNHYLNEIRESFIMGAYYPALTGVCALGERILNHLIINLRDEFKESKEYKKVYKQKSFQYWPTVIETLRSWTIFPEEITNLYLKLNDIRNQSIHFNLETESDTRKIALEAIHIFQKIISYQFGFFNKAPWFFIYPGECYIKKEYERHPFVKLIYIPISPYVGYKNEIQELFPKVIIKEKNYDSVCEITDDEFCELRDKWRKIKKQ